MIWVSYVEEDVLHCLGFSVLATPDIRSLRTTSYCNFLGGGGTCSEEVLHGSVYAYSYQNE